VKDLSSETAAEVVAFIQGQRRPEDIVVVSIHWGENWGYEIPPAQRRFSHQLIDGGAADLIHGHSSHHFKGIEVYNGRLILYGCGDFIDDYEGIAGYGLYRPGLRLAYFASLAGSGSLQSLEIACFRTYRVRLDADSVSEDDLAWIQQALNREGKSLGTSVERSKDGTFLLRW
jgi:poly-gamma-glutamate synthesis protein (capsule biosynthesis protein)